ncbi:hypothetical protein SAMN02745866_01761 [Alteromonadaceae bacterium Bs31]|nr:hypothetical protein SAMN02745866_01761 [Alteromonadaceae bacterium Bs31]
MAQANLNWPLFPLPDSEGLLHFPSLEQSVKQNLQIILRTAPGQQLMRPGYGGGLENYLHEQNSLSTRRRIRDLIVEAIGRWETRIILDRVEVWPVEESASSLKIEIAFRLKRTNEPQQMDVSMELEA